MSKTLIVRMNNNKSFSATGSTEQILSFIKWVDEYNHGIYNGEDILECKTPNDFKVCHIKAIRLGLLPSATKDDIKGNFASTLM